MKPFFLRKRSLYRLHNLLLSLSVMFGLCSVNAQSNCASPVFPASAEIIANAPEAAGYNLVYKLPIPQANQNWATQADIPYSVNNSTALASSDFSRVAYYLKLESAYFGPQWVWVSMDAFTNDLGLISIPTGSTVWQQVVHNMNVRNHTGANKTGIDGNIEFWQNCYTQTNANAVPGASDDYYDFGDALNPDLNCRYGSFQVHDFNAHATEFAYNGWSYADGCDDLGIGNLLEGYPDWTLYNNACYYSLSELYVFVNTVTTASCKNVSISLGASGQAVITPSMVSNVEVGSCGIVDISLSKTTFTCADKGDNIVTISVTDNKGNISTCSSIVTVTDNLIPVIAATGHALALGCNPSAAAINVSLGTATVIDNCAGATLTSSDAPVIINGCTYTQTRTWNAADASGNPAVAVSRTATWKVDNVSPVITANGIALSLSCNPSASVIEAALGTATATDNCGVPTLTVTTSAVTINGSTSSQTRTWVAADACNNSSTVSRTATWTNQCEHFFPVAVTCSQYLSGQSTPLANICYKTLLSAVLSANPASFNYYTTVTAPATLGANASFCVDVVQTKTCNGFRLYNVSKITASDINCNLKVTGSEVSAGQGRVTITGATPGAVYVIAVKYDTSPLLLSTFGLLSAPPTCENSFVSKISATGSAFGSGAVSAGSQGTIKAVPNCSDPLISVTIRLGRPSNELNTIGQNNLNLEVAALPNPSNNYFNLSIHGNTNAPASLRVTDIYGRTMQLNNSIAANTTLTLGHNWPAGTYVVEVIQGEQRKMVKVVKTK